MYNKCGIVSTAKLVSIIEKGNTSIEWSNTAADWSYNVCVLRSVHCARFLYPVDVGSICGLHVKVHLNTLPWVAVYGSLLSD